MKLQGVNLGGWLVLERWMTPSVFKGTKAQDEYSLCTQLGDGKKQILKHHRDTFVTKQDFQWIADNGLNAVRLPVGHWLFGGHEPYVRTANYVKKALDWAQEYELAVIIDLHTAPGSQNGLDHSGKSGATGWHLDPQNITQTIDTVGAIAKTYGSHPSLYGIELLNEPSRDIPLSVLQDYYRRAYAAARSHTTGTIIFSDAYLPISAEEDFIREPKFSKVMLDLHLYQTFGERDQKLSFEEHIAKTYTWKRKINQLGPDHVIVGEWSRALHKTYDVMDAFTAEQSRRFYAQAQQFAF